MCMDACIHARPYHERMKLRLTLALTSALCSKRHLTTSCSPLSQAMCSGEENCPSPFPVGDMGESPLPAFPEGRVWLLMSAPLRMRKQAVVVSFRRMALWSKLREVPSGDMCQALGSQPWITCKLHNIGTSFAMNHEPTYEISHKTISWVHEIHNDMKTVHVADVCWLKTIHCTNS